MKILKNCDELLTWTCTYITEVMKRTTEVPVESLSNAYKTLLHGALCLANGLETLKIQVAQEFGWHTSVLNFSRKHKDAIMNEKMTPNEIDGYIEEELLGFCKNFLINYRRLLQMDRMTHVHNSFREIFGEKIVPSLCNEYSFSSTIARSASRKNALRQNQQRKSVVRKGLYKNKRISVPYPFSHAPL